jgi:4-amino-4-deoxychorismate lyase
MAEAKTEQANSPGIVYLNGKLMPAAAAFLPIDDAGVLYGMGFFETFRTSGGRPHHWDFHRARLAQACAAAGIRVPGDFLAADAARLRETAAALLRENKTSDAVFRYTLTAGRASPLGHGENFAQPSEFMTSRPLPPAAPAEGISLRVLRLARDNGEWLPRPKSLNYANAFAGAEELRRRAATASDEGLFLARDNHCVVETTRQNLAWIEDGKFCYPDPALGAVAGTCLQWALQLGVPSAAWRVGLDGILTVDAIVVLNAVRGITPVRELWDERDQRRLGAFASHAHPLVKQLQQHWNEALQETARAKR